jgi:hypothetical protein
MLEKVSVSWVRTPFNSLICKLIFETVTRIEQELEKIDEAALLLQNM